MGRVSTIQIEPNLDPDPKGIYMMANAGGKQATKGESDLLVRIESDHCISRPGFGSDVNSLRTTRKKWTTARDSLTTRGAGTHKTNGSSFKTGSLEGETGVFFMTKENWFFL